MLSACTSRVPRSGREALSLLGSTSCMRLWASSWTAALSVWACDIPSCMAMRLGSAREKYPLAPPSMSSKTMGYLLALRMTPHDGLVPLDVASQLVDAQGGQLLALSLAHVEDRPRPKAGEPLFGAFSSPGSSSSFGSFPAGLALTTTGQRILMLYSPLQTCLSSCLSARHDERDALGDESLAPACDVRPRHVVTALP